MMERIVWTGTLVAGMEDVYETLHREIWPEMLEDLKRQGISNYTIFRFGQKIIGYYECEDLDRLHAVKANSAVAARWAKSMEGVINIDKAGGRAEGRYQPIFHMA